jgi:lysophospholipase L1-like esterase
MVLRRKKAHSAAEMRHVMTTIFWAGDSTVKTNSIVTYPQTGIGQAFHRYVRNMQVQIENHAENGRSTRSFMEEGRLAAICDRMTAGDFLFIQFGHHDEKEEDPVRYADAEVDYPANLERFVNAARSKGATPVIITPLTRWNRHAGKYRHDDWAQSCRRTAQRLGVALIDLTRMSEELVDRWGETAAQDLYMTLPAGRYPAYPGGLSDKTHLQPLGAINFAALIASGLYRLGGAYAELLCEGYRPDPAGGRISL